MGLLNLEEQLTFYGKYHNNDINKMIHIVCVPLIVWSFLVWAANTGPLLPYEEDSLWRLTPFEPNLALLVVLIYIFYYLLLEPVAGALYTPLLLFMAYNATNFASSFPDNHNSLAGIVHVTSWILQFIGHGFAEKRSPALKENIAQALLLAPLFIWLEVLFTMRYRTELQKRIKERVELAIAKENKE
ncbi:2843_t:CDS:2 [Funneliformis mosseae]|uniref:2843_t:CDS:1 n=1 Tax=Funneliformis mosseae TaxID=27381 RepID=A0A9N9A1Z4_FUNMO|nr:2843_t:CDS:2 [Funneliformis mosseae]